MQAQFVPFRCGTVGNETNLCFHESTCVTQISAQDNSTILQTCICPAGFIHDFTWSHFPNCGMPDYALPVMFGLMTLITAISIAITVYVLRDARSKARSIIAVFLASAVITWAYFLNIVVEQGFYETAAVMYCINMILLNRGTVITTLALATPIFAVLKGDIFKLKTSLVVWEALSAVAQMILSGYLIYHARDSTNVNGFNSATVLSQFVLISFTLGQTVILNIFGWRLLSQIDSVGANPDDSKINDFKGRLKALIWNNNYVLGMLVAMLLLPVMALAIGSFPGQYVFWFIIGVFTPIHCAQIALTFRTRPGEETGSSEKHKSKTASKLQSKQDQLAPAAGEENAKLSAKVSVIGTSDNDFS